MLVAILVLVVAGIVVSVALGVSQSVTREVTEQGRRSGSQLVAEGAVQSIAQAMQSRGDVLGDALAITAADIQAAAELSGGTVTAGASGAWEFPSTTPANLRFTVTNSNTNGDRISWQVLSVQDPDIAAVPPRTWVTVYVRGWTGTGTRATHPAVIKARLRPGTFFDYQVISDVSIAFEPGTVITGGVHTNGFIDDVLLPMTSAMDRIWTTSGTVGCATPAGGKKPLVSTARGHVRSVNTSSCEVQQNTDESISLARAASSFRAIAQNCARGAAGVRCYTAPASAPRNGRYTVNLATGAVTSSWGGSYPAPSVNGYGGRALLFDRDVQVQGRATGRWTVATRATDPMMDATSIRIIGNVDVAAQGITAAGRNAVALIAENDVIVDTTAGCINTVRAAVVAMTGAVTIPREHRANVLIGTPPPVCANITFTGSMASHGTIIMRWNVGATTVGYTNRTYRWDPWLAYYPPPYVPLAQAWELSGLELANGDCFAPGATGGAACT
ncbi:MAG: hypothetical protein JWO69_1121 [Thermoleophilia bacterium]|nr:hypothetical protein [Thermoleophilia bacterium]